MLRVRVTAAPVDGAANRALVRLLAAALDAPASTIRIAVGASGRQKLVEVDDAMAATLRSRWPDLDV